MTAGFINYPILHNKREWEKSMRDVIVPINPLKGSVVSHKRRAVCPLIRRFWKQPYIDVSTSLPNWCRLQLNLHSFDEGMDGWMGPEMATAWCLKLSFQLKKVSMWHMNFKLASAQTMYRTVSQRIQWFERLMQFCWGKPLIHICWQIKLLWETLSRLFSLFWRTSSHNMENYGASEEKESPESTWGISNSHCGRSRRFWKTIVGLRTYLFRNDHAVRSSVQWCRERRKTWILCYIRWQGV